MPVLGLVLTLEDGSKSCRGRVLDRLVRERDVAIGDFDAGKLPIVLDVDGGQDAEPRVRAIADVPGVAHVDVVFSHFEDQLPETDPGVADEAGERSWS